MKKQLLILPAVFLFSILFTFFYLLMIERDPSEIPSNLLNKNVPIFETNSLIKNEKFFSTKEFGDEVTLVNFFATWCKPCRDEHIYLKQFVQKEGLKIIGINYKDNPKKTIKWLNKLGNPYSNIALDNTGKIAINWGVYGIPETFVVNSEGIIKYRHVGPITKIDYKKINLFIENNK